MSGRLNSLPLALKTKALKMKIGVFDSGLGGLVITKAFIESMPQYDYLYYGDSRHLPYGEKTSGRILSYTLAAMRRLIARDCKIIIIACNTATSIALRYVQQRFLPLEAPDVKVLGVVIPTVEVAIENGARRVGVAATTATVRSHIYQTELHKLNPGLAVTEIAVPGLVPAIEDNDFSRAEAVVRACAPEFVNCDSLILGCTHYPLAKTFFRAALPGVKVVSQDELMAAKLENYLTRHPEIESLLTRGGTYRFEVSSLNRHAQKVAALLFPDIPVEKAADG